MKENAKAITIITTKCLQTDIAIKYELVFGAISTAQ